MNKRIFFIHLLNDFTGSTNVLSTVIKYQQKKNDIIIITSNTNGFLSDFDDSKKYFTVYQWHNYKIVLFNIFQDKKK